MNEPSNVEGLRDTQSAAPREVFRKIWVRVDFVKRIEIESDTELNIWSRFNRISEDTLHFDCVFVLKRHCTKYSNFRRFLIN